MKVGMGNLIRVLERIGVEDEAVLPARSAHSYDFIIGQLLIDVACEHQIPPCERPNVFALVLP